MVAHQGARQVNDAGGDAALVHDGPCIDEERYCQQRKAVERPVHFLRQYDQGYLSVEQQSDYTSQAQCECDGYAQQ